MPHLQFELTMGPPADDRRRFTDWVTQRFASVMETGTGHVAVTVRDVPRVDSRSAGHHPTSRSPS